MLHCGLSLRFASECEMTLDYLLSWFGGVPTACITISFGFIRADFVVSYFLVGCVYLYDFIFPLFHISFLLKTRSRFVGYTSLAQPLMLSLRLASLPFWFFIIYLVFPWVLNSLQFLFICLFVIIELASVCANSTVVKCEDMSFSACVIDFVFFAVACHAILIWFELVCDVNYDKDMWWGCQIE